MSSLSQLKKLGASSKIGLKSLSHDFHDDTRWLDCNGDHIGYWRGICHVSRKVKCSSCQKTITKIDFYLRCSKSKNWTMARRYCEKCADEHFVMCQLGGP